MTAHNQCSAESCDAPLWAKLSAYVFWIIAGPFVLYAGLMIVGATVEHFTP